MSTSQRLSLLYRGPLASCNYGCSYCPFPVAGDQALLDQDRRDLARFVDWATACSAGPLAIFFTPRGEALIHRSYRAALAQLSRLPHIERVAVQTNLSAPLDWLDDCVPERVGIWATYHREKANRERFLAHCRKLHEAGISLSVGVVGLRSELEAIERLRAELPDAIYLWVNAYKREANYYLDSEVARLRAVDPLFLFNLEPQPSLGRACATGRSVLAVEGDGSVRRCHFVERPLGNLYRAPLAELRDEAPCPNERCRCHIGYVHLEHLRLQEVFGDGILERARPAWTHGAARRSPHAASRG